LEKDRFLFPLSVIPNMAQDESDDELFEDLISGEDDKEEEFIVPPRRAVRLF